MKELPVTRAGAILSNKINNGLLDYNPRHKLNSHESMLILLNESVKGNIQICAEEFKMTYVNTLLSRRWSITPYSLYVGCTK